MIASKKVIMAAIVTVISLGLLEAAARMVVGPGQQVDMFQAVGKNITGHEVVPAPEFFRPIPNATMPYSLQYRINADGFRHDVHAELPAHPPDNVMRIVTSGDSVTFGHNTRDHETYPAQLQRRLGDGYVVYNLGRGGYTSYQGLAVAERYHKQLQPDVIIIGFGWNDAYDAFFSDTERAKHFHYQQTAALSVVAPLRRVITRHVRLVQLLPSRPKVRRVSEVEFEQNLLAIGRLADHAIYFTLPWVPCQIADQDPEFCRQMIKESRHRQYNNIIRRVANETRQPLVDAARLFVECEEKGYACLTRGFLQPNGHCDPIHPNAFGAKWLAAMIAQKVEQL